MYIVSDYLNRMISSEQVGVWVESSDNNFALIAKIPSNVAKAIYMGAKLELLVGITIESSPRYSIALKVSDSIDNPFIVILPQRWINSCNLLNYNFFSKDITLTIYDEIDSLVIGAIVEISLPYDATKLSELLNYKLFPIVSLESADELFDAFSHHIYPLQYISNGIDMEVFISDINIKNINSYLNFKATDNGYNYYDFSTDIDGIIQENQIHNSLRVFFGKNAYHSPQVTIGKKSRELTDILALSEDYYICIESKCISIDILTLNKSSDRIISGVIKSCSKAIKQLEGTLKAIRRGEVIKSNNKEIINFNRLNSGHLIILISEYIHSKRWDSLIEPIKLIRDKHNAMIHILSLSELSYILKLSQSQSEILNAILIERYEAFHNNNTFNIISFNSSLTCD